MKDQNSVSTSVKAETKNSSNYENLVMESHNLRMRQLEHAYEVAVEVMDVKLEAGVVHPHTHSEFCEALRELSDALIQKAVRHRDALLEKVLAYENH